MNMNVNTTIKQPETINGKLAQSGHLWAFEKYVRENGTENHIENVDHLYNKVNEWGVEGLTRNDVLALYGALVIEYHGVWPNFNRGGKDIPV